MLFLIACKFYSFVLKELVTKGISESMVFIDNDKNTWVSMSTILFESGSIKVLESGFTSLVQIVSPDTLNI